MLKLHVRAAGFSLQLACHNKPEYQKAISCKSALIVYIHLGVTLLLHPAAHCWHALEHYTASQKALNLPATTRGLALAN